MEWSDLRILLEVARAGSFTATSRKLGINATTVARRIEALESTLGASLVERGTGGIRLTDAGQRSVARAEAMETAALELEREVFGRDNELAGDLTVTTTDVTATFHADLFSDFCQRYPKIRLRVSTSFAEASLARKEAEVAIRWTNEPEPNLFGRRLVRLDLAPFASTSLHLELGKSSRLEDYPWLAWSHPLAANRTQRWLERRLPQAPIRCHYNSPLAMYSAAEAGLGAVFMPVAYGESRASLVRIGAPEKELAYEVWALTYPDLAKVARVRAFITHAGKYFAVLRKS